MEISEKIDRTVNVISLRGRLDANSADVLEEKLKPLTAADRAHIVLNLDGLEYISSSGLRVLLAGIKKTTKRQGDIRLACLQRSVKDVFDISGFTQFFKTYDKEEEAINSFQ